MFIGWLQEWFDSLKEKYNDQEVIEYTNEAIHDIWKHQYDCINTLEEARENFCSEHYPLCNECGNDSFYSKTVMEDMDADGHRGRPVTYLKCDQCGKDLDE